MKPGRRGRLLAFVTAAAVAALHDPTEVDVQPTLDERAALEREFQRNGL